MSKIENYDTGGAGELVFYAHGSESMRTYLGLSKFHARADCPVLARRGGTIVQDRVTDVVPGRRCKLCSDKPRVDEVPAANGAVALAPSLAASGR